MKVHSTNYKNTFIEVSEDSPILKSEIPPVKRNKTLANIQYEMISENPYKYTSDELMLECYIQKNGIAEEDRPEAHKDLFSKGQPCFRSAALCKRYGFGINSDYEGKVALYPVESTEYEDFLGDDSVVKVKAMRNRRG